MLLAFEMVYSAPVISKIEHIGLCGWDRDSVRGEDRWEAGAIRKLKVDLSSHSDLNISAVPLVCDIRKLIIYNPQVRPKLPLEAV